MDDSLISYIEKRLMQDIKNAKDFYADQDRVDPRIVRHPEDVIDPRSATDTEPSTVWLSIRVTPALRARLRLASAQRHVAEQTPWTLQDIVAEALDQWCTRNSV